MSRKKRFSIEPFKKPSLPPPNQERMRVLFQTEESLVKKELTCRYINESQHQTFDPIKIKLNIPCIYIPFVDIALNGEGALYCGPFVALKP